MNAKLFLAVACFLLLTSMSAAQGIHMLVCLHVTRDSVASTCTRAIEGNPEDYVLDYQEYLAARVYSLKNELLYNFTFEKSFKVFMDPGGSFETDEFDRDISFPHYRNIGRLEIWDGREKKLVLDLSAYATCNEDMVCDSTESILTCPEDCREKAPVVRGDASVSEETVHSADKVAPAQGGNNLIIVIIAAGILVIIVLWLLLRNGRQNQ